MSTVLPAAAFRPDASVPVLIVGGGAAGLVAALAARRSGLLPLVLERDPVPAGSTALSAGLVPAAGTRWQAAAGIADTPEAFAADITAKAHGEPDPAIVAAVASGAAPVLHWLADAHGLPFSVVADFGYPGHGARRMHGTPSRSGRELVDRLRAAAEAAGAEILCDAHVTALYADGPRVHGVAVTRPDGAAEHIGCDQLVLACNGYGGNPDLVARHIPSMAGATYFGHRGNRGDALLWGEALGAAVRDLPGHQGHGSVAHPAGILLTWATITEGGFQVNANGERFGNEAAGYSEAGALVLAQPGGMAWTVFDDRTAAIARQFEDFRHAEAAGVVLRADTVAALAALMRVPAAALERTAAEVDALKASGGTDARGRCFAGVPELQPPFRAVRVTGALFHTQGGLRVDPGARVLDEGGRPLPNLWAAGGAACGVSGRQASGYLSGNGLLTALVLGEAAGRNAAAAASSHPPGPNLATFPPPEGAARMTTAVTRRLALATAASLAAPRIGRAQGASVKIGLIHPVTGAVAYGGQLCRQGGQAAIADVNAAGGIRSMNGAKVEALLGDAQSRPDIGASLVDQMAEAGAAGLTGCFASPIGLAASQAAAKYNLPFCIDSGISDALTTRGLKNVYRLFPNNTATTTDAMAALDQINRKAGSPARSAIIVHEDGEFGTGTAALLTPRLEAIGLKVLATIPHATPTRDFTNIVLRIKEAKPDIVLVSDYNNEYVLLARTLTQQRVDLAGIYSIAGGGFNLHFVKDQPAVAENIIDFNHWYNPREPRSAAFRKRFEDAGATFSYELLFGYFAVRLLADAIERAGTTDKEQVIAALAASTYGDSILTYGPTRFVDGQNVNAHATAQQVQKGDIHVVWPDGFADAAPVFPRPKA